MQAAVFGLVAASFTAVYITQPVLPVIRVEFGVSETTASLTTCLAAYLARSLPVERLSVVMGSYVSATIAGGMGGRLLGGWIHPPLHWRYAFVTSAVLLVAAAAAAARILPREPAERAPEEAGIGFLQLVSRADVIRMLAVAFTSFAVFSAIFNYLPFYLSAPPIRAPVRVVTLLYLAYIVGMAAGPLAGKLSNRLGSGPTMSLGAAVLALAIVCTLVPSLGIIAASLPAVCAGFFGMHAAALGTLNRRLTASRGRANSLYVLSYYLGGASGISAAGYAYTHAGWRGCVGLGVAVLLVPFAIGVFETSRARPHG